MFMLCLCLLYDLINKLRLENQLLLRMSRPCDVVWNRNVGCGTERTTRYCKTK